MATPLIFDAHLDLAMNALEWNRDLTRPVAELRAREAGKTGKPDWGNGTVSLPEMRRGGIGICIATLIARVEHNAYSPFTGPGVGANPGQTCLVSRDGRKRPNDAHHRHGDPGETSGSLGVNRNDPDA